VDLAKDGFLLRPLDRAMEYEADRLGIVLAARAGYDPYGLVAVLQTLSQMKSDGSGGSVFDTHPAPTDRLADIEGFIPALDRYASHPQLEGRYKQAVK
jgi:predicted Zn-dependent protease